MAEACPRCDLHFERIEGHWMGAIGLNTVISFGAMLVVLVTALVATGASSDASVVIPTVATAAVVPIVISPTCRTLWTAIDIAMRKLGADEVNWQFVDRQQADGGKVSAAESETRDRD